MSFFYFVFKKPCKNMVNARLEAQRQTICGEMVSFQQRKYTKKLVFLFALLSEISKNLKWH